MYLYHLDEAEYEEVKNTKNDDLLDFSDVCTERDVLEKIIAYVNDRGGDIPGFGGSLDAFSEHMSDWLLFTWDMKKHIVFLNVQRIDAVEPFLCVRLVNAIARAQFSACKEKFIQTGDINVLNFDAGKAFFLMHR